MASTKRPGNLTRAEWQLLCGAKGRDEIIKLAKMTPDCDGTDNRAKVWNFETLAPLLHAALFPKASDEEVELKKEKLREEIRVRRLQGDAKALDINVARKRLVPVDEVYDYGKAMAVEIRTQLESIPSSMAVRLSQITDSREAEAVLEDRISGVLKTLEAWRWDASAWKQRHAEDIDDDDDEEATDD